MRALIPGIDVALSNWMRTGAALSSTLPVTVRRRAALVARLLCPLFLAATLLGG
jgi:hypothetical protein